jgi:IMP dehydrogenase
VRSSMSYVNATTIAEFQANAEFIRITNAGLTESHPHATLR